jgi:hypothetical protein
VRCAAHLSRVVAGMPLDFVQEAIRLPLHSSMRRTQAGQGSGVSRRYEQHADKNLTQSNASNLRAARSSQPIQSPSTCGCLNSFEYSSSQYLQAKGSTEVLLRRAHLQNPWLIHQHKTATPFLPPTPCWRCG